MESPFLLALPPERSADRTARGQITRILSLIRLAFCSCPIRVHQPLTIIGKDRPDIPQRQPRRSLRSPHTFEMRQRRTAMALKVELKPNERIIIGSCVVTNTDQRARVLIEGNAAILREKDIMTPETADTPAKLVYLAVQLMYISPDPENNHATYFNLVREIVTAVPSAWPIIEEINNNILSGELYRALKAARKLIAYEQKLRELHEATQKRRAIETAA
jgi:flagellar protein FlbT